MTNNQRSVIYKFTCPPGSSFSVPMQDGAEILCVQMQNFPRIWAKVEPDKEMVPHYFKWVPTGGDVPIGKYIGTIQVQDGAFVWHLFEVTP